MRKYGNRAVFIELYRNENQGGYLMKKTLKRATALLAAAAISLSAVVVAPVEAEAADEAGIRAFVTRMYEVCLAEIEWNIRENL